MKNVIMLAIFAFTSTSLFAEMVLKNKNNRYELNCSVMPEIVVTGIVQSGIGQGVPSLAKLSYTADSLKQMFVFSEVESEKMVSQYSGERYSFLAYAKKDKTLKLTLCSKATDSCVEFISDFDGLITTPTVVNVNYPVQTDNIKYLFPTKKLSKKIRDRFNYNKDEEVLVKENGFKLSCKLLEI